MAQVKKLKKGGGVFEMNGRTLEGQDAIDRVTGHTGETTAGILRAIKNGLRTGYNPESNAPYVTDWEGNDLTEEYLSASKKVSPDDSMARRVLGATFNSLGHRYARESLMLGDVDMTPAQKVETETPNYTQLRRGSGFFNYTTDKDGKKTYIVGPENTDRESILQEGRKYLEMLADQGEDAVKKIYTTNGWKDTDLQKLRNWFAQYDNAASRENYWRQFLDRIKSYNLSDSDREVLSLFGFNETPANGGDEGVEEPIVYGNAVEGFDGNKDALKQAGIYITKNKNGIFHANIDPNSKYYGYNVFYLGDVPWAPKGYERGFMINGDLYRESDVLNPARTDLHPYVNDWYTADKSHGYKAYYDALNNLGIGFIGSRRWNGAGDDDYGALGNEYDYNTMYNEHLYDYFSNPERGFAGPVNILNATGLYNVPQGGAVYGYLPNGWQNQQGFPELQYIYYNPVTKQITEGTGNLQRSIFRSNRDIDYTDLYTDPKGNKYHFVANIGKDSEGKPLNTIIQDFDGNYYLYKVGQDGSTKEPIQLDPKEVEQILKNPNDSKYNESKYFDTIRYKGTSSKTGRIYTPTRPKQIPNGYYYDWKTKELVPITSRKKGGILKFQAGGGTGYTRTNMNKLDTTSKNDYTANHVLGSGTEEEIKQVYATLADIGALGVSFINPIAGAAMGAGTSIYRYNLDKARGEERAGRRLAMNLALDTASAIPLLGTGVKAGRIVNTIRKGGRAFIAGVAALGGSTELIMTLNKIASGDKWTYDDLNRVIHGIGALTVAGASGVGLRNFGKLASEKAASLKRVEKLPTAKIKTSKGVEEVQISKKDLKALTANNKKFTNENELDKELGTILRKSGVKISDSQIKGLSKKFGIEFEKGAKTGKLLHPKTWWGREPGKATFDTTPEAPGSTFYYMMHPDKAANVIGKGTTAKEVKAAQEAAGNRTWRQRVLLRTTAENPRAFGNMFLADKEAGLYSPVKGPLGGGFLKSGNVNSREIINYKPSRSNVRKTSAKSKKTLSSETTPKVKPVEPTRITDHRRLLTQQAGQMEVPPLTRVTDPFFGGIEFKPTMAPKRIVRLTESGIQYEKKGGKIVKGQNGLYNNYFWYKDDKHGYPFGIDYNQLWKTDNNLNNRSYFEISGVPKYGINPVTDGLYEISKGFDVKPRSTYSMQSDQAYINPNNVNTGFVTDFSKSLNTEKPKDEVVSGEKDLDVPPPKGRFDPKHGIEFNEDWGADFARLTQTIDGIQRKGAALNKGYDALLKMPFIAPQKTMLRYNSAPIDYEIQQALKPWEEFKFADSDADRVLAGKLAVADKKSQIEAAGNKERSNQYYQTQLANADIGNYNNEQLTNMANAKGANTAQTRYMRHNTEANLISEVTNAIQTYMYQHAQDNRDINEYRKALTLQQENTEAAEFYQNRINKALREGGYKAQYEALPLAEQTKYGDISKWLQATNPSAYNRIYTRNKNWYEKELGINNAYYFDSSKMTPFYIPSRKDILVAKSGGSVYSRRPTKDVMAINGQKQAQKSVDDISKALLKLLHKLMK